MELGSADNTLNIILEELGIAAMGLALHLEVYLRIIKKYQKNLRSPGGSPVFFLNCTMKTASD